MHKLGLDWGTTTTSISFFQPEKNSYDYLRFGANDHDFFPTIIAYRQTKDGDEEIHIGSFAKQRMYSPSYDAYENLKLNLNATATNRHNRKKSIFEASRDFIGRAIGEYVRAYNPKIEELGIVLTIPDNWGKDIFLHPSLLLLEQIIRDIMPEEFDTDTLVSFCSEPIAATAYYVSEICRDKFKGKLLIVDFGGGTLDLTLCNVESPDDVTVMRRCGKIGKAELGCAGEAFDWEITRAIVESYNLPENGNFFQKLRDSFENAKMSSPSLNSLLRDYYSSSSHDRKIIMKKEALTIFDVVNNDEYPVTVGEIIKAFEKVNLPALKECITEIKTYCERFHIRINDGSSFRVIFTGGFSNLYCIEASVREMLGVPPNARDERFDSGISREFRSTAIAHGAAIIAEGKINIDLTLQKDIGFKYFDVFSSEEKKATLMKSNDLVRNLRNPIYFDSWLWGTNIDKNSAITIFIEDVVLHTNMELHINLTQLSEAGSNNRYRLGLSLGKHNTLFLHCIDTKGREKKTPVGGQQ